MSQTSRWRELAVLVLPLLVLLAFGFYWQHREAIQKQELTGPYRAVITRIEPMPLTAFEAAAGFDTKVKIYAADLGRPAERPLPTETEARYLTDALQLVGRIKGREIGYKAKISADEGYKELRSDVELALYGHIGKTRAQAREGTIVALAKTSAFPLQAEVSLEGPLVWNLVDGSISHRMKRESAPARVSYLLRRPNQKITIPSFPPSPLDIEKLETTYLSPSYQRTSMFRDGNNAILRIITDTPSCPTSNPSCFYWLDMRLTNRKQKAANVRIPPIGSHFVSSPQRKYFERRLPAADAPLTWGEVRYEGALSFDQTTPVPFSVVVRPAWITQKPKHLELESVKVNGGTIQVTVLYSGQRTLQTATEMGRYFDNRDDNYDGQMTWWNDTQNDYLITNWSQHWSFGGREYWYPNTVSVSNVSNLGNSRYLIEYKTNAMNALRPGQQAVFRAQIGLKDEGFLPVEAQLVK